MNLLTHFGRLIDQLIIKKPDQKHGSNKEAENSICIELEIHDYAKLKFEDLFEKEEKRQEIQNKLVKREMRHPVSGKWIDTAKAYKMTIVCMIKKLFVLGHFHKDKVYSAEEIQAVCSNSFGVKISIHHIRKTKWDDVKLDFIT